VRWVLLSALEKLTEALEKLAEAVEGRRGREGGG
jgi:hypothetical protein